MVEYRLKLLAGRGRAGSMNWGGGGGYPKKVVDKWKRNLKPHIGRTVYLSGGGGWDIRRAKLKSVHISKHPHERGRYQMRAKLTNVDLKYGRYDAMRGGFEPWIDSWQLNKLERIKKPRRRGTRARSRGKSQRRRR